MKKKNSCVLAICVCAFCALTVTVSAYYADVVASHTVTTTGVSGYSTITANSKSGLIELYTQAEIMDDDLNSYGFGNKNLPNPKVDTLKATATAAKSKLTSGKEYYVQGYGHIKYMTKYGEQKDYYTDEDYFTYRKNASIAVGAADVQRLRSQYSEERARYIFEEFNMTPDQYDFAWNQELLDYVTTDNYLSIRGTMNIQAGTTTPSFFINDEKIFGVCQDANAVSYIYEFSESSDGLWILINTQQQQDAGRYEEICQSFDAYQATR